MTDGAGEWFRGSRMLWAELRTSRSAALPGCRSSDGRNGQAPSTPRPSGHWCIRTSGCGMPIGVRSHFANTSIFRLAPTATAPARAAPSVRACPRARSRRSRQTATTWNAAPRTSRRPPVRDVSTKDASPGTPVRLVAGRCTGHPRRRSTCAHSSTQGGACDQAVERWTTLRLQERSAGLAELTEWTESPSRRRASIVPVASDHPVVKPNLGRTRTRAPFIGPPTGGVIIPRPRKEKELAAAGTPFDQAAGRVPGTWSFRASRDRVGGRRHLLPRIAFPPCVVEKRRVKRTALPISRTALSVRLPCGLGAALPPAISPRGVSFAGQWAASLPTPDWRRTSRGRDGHGRHGTRWSSGMTRSVALRIRRSGMRHIDPVVFPQVASSHQEEQR